MKSRRLSLFLTFLKIGAFTFGGGYAMIALLEHELIEKKGWIGHDEFLDMAAIAESTPGPVAVNAATYVGFHVAGVSGAALATLAVCLPSFLIIFAISQFFDRFLALTTVGYAFRGIQVCVVYLIASAGWKMVRKLPHRPLDNVILAIVLLLWHRESRRLGASNADAEARERAAAARLSAAEARLAAAEQAVSAERELRQRYEAQAQALTEQRTRTEAELAALRASSETELASLRAKNAEERAAEKAEREKLEETFRAQFKNLATEILGEHSVRFRQTSQEQIDSLLKPFRDNITDFRKRVEEIYTTQTSQRGELKAELKNLMELNRRITAETTNLTNALKGNSKVQGDWGEMLLETILDSSALIKGIHYQTQYNIKDEEGRNLRPDVVLHLPEKKDIVIDSKVSLTAFVGYTSAESEEERRRHLAAHVASVRQHVAELGRKEYQRRLNSPDFVIMFIPNEPAFLAALQNDPAIWADAYDRKVIVSSPTNLFALLKLVADLWKYNDQDKNTKEIAACGLKLYEQLVAFTSSLEGVGTALDKARDAYEDAHKRLCTGNDNIVRVGERLRKTASLQTKKRHSARTLEIAGADEDPAALSATESAAETAAKSAAETAAKSAVKAAATDTTAQ